MKRISFMIIYSINTKDHKTNLHVVVFLRSVTERINLYMYELKLFGE